MGCETRVRRRAVAHGFSAGSNGRSTALHGEIVRVRAFAPRGDLSSAMIPRRCQARAKVGPCLSDFPHMPGMCRAMMPLQIQARTTLMAPLSPQPPQSRKWIALGMPLLTAMFIETFGGAGIFPDSVAASLVQGLALAGIATAYYLIATT